VEAVRCAIGLQNAIEERTAAINPARRMRFRIGLHLGDVLVDGDQLQGDGINIAARLEHLAEPGGILVSSDIYRQVLRKVDASFEDLGPRRLRNIADPLRVYRVVSSPTPWLQRQFRRHFNLKRLAGAAAALALVGLTVAGAVQLRQPHALWAKLIDDTSAAFPDQPSIVVLPLRNVSGDASGDYFSDGLTTDISGELARYRNLFVVASNSAFTYKDRPAKAQDIGRDLRVRYILEGTVLRAANRVRVSAQLVDAESGWQLWAERYDRHGEDVLAISDDLISAVVAKLAVEVDAAERNRIMTYRTQSSEAYNHYLKGRQLFNNYSKDDNAAAIAEFSEAIALDGNFARAFAWRGYAHLQDYKEGWTDDGDQSAALASQDADHAVELAPDDYVTHWTVATIHVERGETARALEVYDRAVALNGNDPDMLVEMADMLSLNGEPARAIAQIEQAKLHNPRHPEWYDWSAGLAHFQARDYAAAAAALAKLSDPPNEAVLLHAISQAKLGQPRPVDDVLAQLRRKDPDWTPEHLDRMPFTKAEDEQHWLSGLALIGLAPLLKQAPQGTP
jgi:TolB-like protein